MTTIIMWVPLNLWVLGAIFVIGGVYAAIQESVEDSFCAELVDETQHGTAFGALATINGVGDFASSVVVGLLWTSFGTSVASGYSAILFIGGGALVPRAASRQPSTRGKRLDG